MHTRIIFAVGLLGMIVPGRVAAEPPPAQPAEIVVTAEPATGLVDGQVIKVTGTGFTDFLMEIFECRADAVDISGCDPDNAYFADLDPDGVVREDFPVDARIFTEDGEFDCRSIPNSCKVGIGFLLDDFSTNGFALLDFDPDAPLLPTPTIKIRPDKNLRDQQVVNVRGGNLSSLFETFVFQCVAGRPTGPDACNFEQDVRAVADDKGRIRVDYRVAALLQPTTGPPFDCTSAPGACVIELAQGFSTSPDRFVRAGLAFRKATPPPGA